MKLAINGGEKVSSSPLSFNWPVIDPGIERVVREQLYTSISIYDNSGVFGEFEAEFSRYHGMPYSLLVNSGTSGLQSAYYSLMLQPGDEVICPVYTFHATISPMMHFGLTPVMVDCDEYGQIDPSKIEQCITEKTKAIVVTHMWGYAADIQKIAAICKKYGLTLIEDCSHSHGATIDDQPLGSFGDISVWSLQGQKIITGGEGGIILFKNRGHFERSVIYGHYNKRSKSQIGDESLKRFALTGAGLKLRASTLNVAMAQYMFRQIDTINFEKNQNAQSFLQKAHTIGGIQVLDARPHSNNSWYAQVILYDEAITGVPRELFVKALHAEGLVEFDVPGSTGPLNEEPLFNQPSVLFPYLYDHDINNNHRSFSNAEKFHSKIIKLPVWTFAENMTDIYIQGFNKVVDNMHDLRGDR